MVSELYSNKVYVSRSLFLRSLYTCVQEIKFLDLSFSAPYFDNCKTPSRNFDYFCRAEGKVCVI